MSTPIGRASPELQTAFRALQKARCEEKHDAMETILRESPGAARVCEGLFRTALMDAAEAGDATSVRVLAPYSDANARNSDQATALLLAADGGHDDCVEALLPCSDTSLCSETGWTALMAAARSGNAETVRLLLPTSCPSHAAHNGETALMVAARSGNVASVTRLLPVSDPLARDAMGYTALMHATDSENDALGVVRLLLPVSDAQARGLHDRRTALEIAAFRNHSLCVDALVGATDVQGRDSALIAVAAAGSASYVRKLLPYANPRATDDLGRTALLAALSPTLGLKPKKPEAIAACVELLLPDSSVEHEDSQGFSAFKIALLHNDPALLDPIAARCGPSTWQIALEVHDPAQLPMTRAAQEHAELLDAVESATTRDEAPRVADASGALEPTAPAPKAAAAAGVAQPLRRGLRL